jgi:ribosome biogenesis protein BRX1
MAKSKRSTSKRQKVDLPVEKVKEESEVEEVETEEQAPQLAQHDDVENDVDGDDKEDGDKEDDDKESPDTNLLVSDGRYRNKQRCLVLCSRGVTARYRHLLEDLRTLMPHHKKESKLDPGAEGAGRAVNDIAEMRSCNTVLFLECRKRQDAYLWMGRVGTNVGPSVKFHVSNIHTMDELRLTGNCMKGSRPILTFDTSFDQLGHLKLLKELFTDIFGIPRGHPKSKPFVDRVMAFYYADKKVRYRSSVPLSKFFLCQ